MSISPASIVSIRRWPTSFFEPNRISSFVAAILIRSIAPPVFAAIKPSFLPASTPFENSRHCFAASAFTPPISIKRFVFLTNNFQIPSPIVAAIYHQRWQIELFFKWIKQHLRIKRFFGTSPNAVKTQIWTAMATYALIAIVKKRFGLEHSLYTILQILSTALFEKTPVQLVFQRYDDEISNRASSNQLTLFEI